MVTFFKELAIAPVGSYISNEVFRLVIDKLQTKQLTPWLSNEDEVSMNTSKYFTFLTR